MNSLSLDVLTAGRRVAITVEEIEELTAQDLLDSAKFFVTTQGPVQRIRQSHHEIARLIAAGHSNKEVARICNRSHDNIKVLQRSPAFQELIAHYQERRTEEAFDFERRIKEAASEGLEELSDRLLDPTQRAALPTRELYKITTGLLDRAGHNPVARRESRNWNIGLTADDIKKMKDEARQETIEVEFTEVQDDLVRANLPSPGVHSEDEAE